MSRNLTYHVPFVPLHGFTDAELLTRIDVSDEASRTYVFGADKAYRIDLPLLVAVKKSADGGHSHRVVDAAGGCHYIPKGWIAIYWTLRTDTAIPLPDLSEQMGAAQEVTTEDLEKAKDYLAEQSDTPNAAGIDGDNESIDPLVAAASPSSEARDAAKRKDTGPVGFECDDPIAPPLSEARDAAGGPLDGESNGDKGPEVVGLGPAGYQGPF